jgi:hypothetical protein
MLPPRERWRRAWCSVRLWPACVAHDETMPYWSFFSAADWVTARLVLKNRAKRDELFITGLSPASRLAYFKKWRLVPTAYPKNKNENIRQDL